MQEKIVLHFLKPGLFTTIQDSGRSGHEDQGVPHGGALDRTSARLANTIVGNDPSGPVLEITVSGPEIRFSGACQIAITGADMTPILDGQAVARNRLVMVPAHATLKFGRLQSGCRAYLAVGGHWHVHTWLGSAGALAIGDHALVPDAIMHRASTIEIDTRQSPDKHEGPPPVAWPEELEVRVFAGPEFQRFSGEQLAVFFNTLFTVEPASNRMGCRLDPRLPGPWLTDEIITSAVLPGTVQVTRELQPVILLADAQTTGGYPRIAQVLQADLDALAQLKPGDGVRFRIVKATGLRD